MTPVLIVDDCAADRDAARNLLTGLDRIEVFTAVDGEDAVRQLERQPAMLVIADLHMPRMGGLELLRIVRERFPASPVIVMTGHGSEELAAEALNEGASGYVLKQFLDRQLSGLVSKVMSTLIARNDRRRLEQVLDFTETRFVLSNEIELVPAIVGYIQEKVVRLLPVDVHELLQIGLAIDEALMNAICHGNLEVRSELKERDDGQFYDVVRTRQRQRPFAHRKVHVKARVSSEEFTCVIRDEGQGFDVLAVPNPLAPENVGRPYGRGLHLIRQFMDEVQHNQNGNEITILKRHNIAAAAEW